MEITGGAVFSLIEISGESWAFSLSVGAVLVVLSGGSGVFVGSGFVALDSGLVALE